MSALLRDFQPGVHRTSRLLDFTSERSLAKQIGHPSPCWPRVVAKELVDNAIDAAETASVPPRFRLSVTDRLIAVADNGPGIAASVVDDLRDFSVRVSSREAYARPWRGQQGNALKTVLAIPLALTGTASRLEIWSRGLHHVLEMSVDQIEQEPKVSITSKPGSVKTGTVVCLHWPWSNRLLADARAEIYRLVELYGLFNPHVAGRARISDALLEWEPTNTAWQRWRPCQQLVPGWYDIRTFERLFSAELRTDRDAGQVRLVRDWLAGFRGLSSTSKRKEIVAALGLARATLEELVKDDAPDSERLAKLLAAMQDISKSPKAELLGIVGKDHLLERLQLGEIGQQTFEYRKILDDNAAPRVTEIAFCWNPARKAPEGDDDEEELHLRRVYAGINNSAALLGEGAFPRIAISSGYNWSSHGLDGLLHEHSVRETDQCVVVMHHAGARLVFDEYGKSKVDITGPHGQAVKDGVLKVTEEWHKQRLKEIRNQRAEQNREERLAPKPVVISAKEAAAERMAAAYMEASAGSSPRLAAQRQVYYKARDWIQRRTGKPFDFGYFCGLLDDYMAEHPKETAEWNVVKDSRGNLYEPHSGKIVPLSTLDVRAYIATRPWRHKYGAILFCEKEGFTPLFQQVKLAERFDMAIMSSKGTSTVAVRTIVDAAVADGVPVYCIRDFDFTGFNIAATLARDTKRYSFKTAGAVDLGLRLTDAKAWNLPSEGVSYSGARKLLLRTRGEILGKIAAPLRANGATDDEIAFLATHRIELNAFSSGDLVKWIEDKLSAAGVVKVVPAADTVAAEAWRQVRDMVRDRIKAELAAKIEDEVAGMLFDGAELAAEVRETLAARPTSTWRGALRGIVAREQGLQQ